MSFGVVRGVDDFLQFVDNAVSVTIADSDGGHVRAITRPETEHEGRFRLELIQIKLRMLLEMFFRTQLLMRVQRQVTVAPVPKYFEEGVSAGLLDLMSHVKRKR